MEPVEESQQQCLVKMMTGRWERLRSSSRYTFTRCCGLFIMSLIVNNTGLQYMQQCCIYLCAVGDGSFSSCLPFFRFFFLLFLHYSCSSSSSIVLFLISYGYATLFTHPRASPLVYSRAKLLVLKKIMRAGMQHSTLTQLRRKYQGCMAGAKVKARLIYQ